RLHVDYSSYSNPHSWVRPMRTIQMTLDEDLVEAVDRAVKKLKTSRSAFTRAALRAALGELNMKQLEAKHRRGYERQPVADDEFSIWESEQDWGDA
ncbi:MAG: ribbon-helix-helix domain-containing protein, partial [Pirellulales bacterium]|nr:ribbon-helix-helix domain-containing protein [Pirellulales bacterium]